MKSVRETYKGKEIFIAHYDHMTLEEVRTEVAAVKSAIAQAQRATAPLLVLIDVRGTLISPEVLNMFKEVAALSGSRNSKSAILGITGARRAILEIVNKFSKAKTVPFDDAQKAKDWLVS